MITSRHHRAPLAPWQERSAALDAGRRQERCIEQERRLQQSIVGAEAAAEHERRLSLSRPATASRWSRPLA
jgi:hypothetical protein